MGNRGKWHILLNNINTLFLKGGRLYMGLETETLAIFLLAFVVVIIFSIVTIVSMMIKYKSKSYIWFLVQVVMLAAAFFIFLGLIIIDSNTPRRNAIDLGIMGLLWTGSMLCMLIGVSHVSRQKDNQTEREKEEYNPGFLKGLGMLVFYTLICSLVPQIVLLIISKLTGFSQYDPLAGAFGNIAGLVLLILWLKRKYVINFKHMVSIKSISIIFFIPMTLSIIGFQILLSEVGIFTTRVIPINGFWEEIFNSAFGSGFSTWKGILAVAIIAPIVEETIFRGMILKGFLKHYSVTKSVILSALLFGLIHMNPWQFVTAFAAGIVLGWWYVKTDSIIATIFGHALNNGMIYIISFIGISIPGFNTALGSLSHQPLWFDFLGVTLFACGTIWLIKLFNKRQPEVKEITINA